MKRSITVIAAMVCGALSVGAQDTRQTVQLSKDERQEVTEITGRIEEATRVARAELEIIQAQLSRLLLSADADLRKVRTLLKTALDWELEVRLAEIQRELEIRKLLGDRRWTQYLRTKDTQRAVAARTIIEEQTDRLYAQLERLTGEKREDVEEKIRSAIRQALTRTLQSAAEAGD